MASAVIGALRVVLGMNAGEFAKDGKKAEGVLGRLERKFGISAKAIRVAGAAMASAFSAAKISGEVSRVLTELDRLTKMSRSIGVPVEQLSSLQHAAELSGASVDDLGKAFRNFARNAQSAARGPTDFSRALDSLGVSWRDAEGQFRRADQVMFDVADRFAGMADGAGKTALAMKIFGEERGPKLISFLNAGSAGLREMQFEAERLGLTFDQKAGEAAERFNDQMDRVGKAFDGISTRLTVALLPGLEAAVGKFESLTTQVSLLIEEFSKLEDRSQFSLQTDLDAVNSELELVGSNLAELEARQQRILDRGGILGKSPGLAEIGNRLNETYEKQNALLERRQTLIGAMLAKSTEVLGGGNGGSAPPIVQGLTAQNEALALLNEAERERLAIMQAMQDPYDVMIEKQTRLNELFGASAKDAETLARANQMAAAAMHNAYAGAASKVSGALTSLFDQSKGLAIANALINTYEAVSAALKNPPGPPFSYAYAAAALASGMAQVQAIRSTNKSGSGGSAASAASGGGATQAAAAQPAQQQSFSINLEGEKFGREQVRGLIESINDAISDGAVLRVA